MKTDTKRSLKRLTSMLLTLCMVVGLTAVSPGVTAWADTELIPEDDTTAPNTGAAESTAYNCKGAGTTYGYVFDLVGMRDGQTGYSTSGYKCVFGNGGFKTRIKVGTTESYYNASHNGGVVTVDEVELKVTIRVSKDKKYILADYDIYNESDSPKDVIVGSAADTYMGTGNDKPKTIKTSRGVKMVDHLVADRPSTGTLTSYDLIVRDDSLGLTTPDGVWIGNHASQYTNVLKPSAWQAFDDSVTEYTPTDSAMSYSWKFTIRPHEPIHKRVAFAVRAKSYYVSGSSGDDSNEGIFSAPLKTIAKAVEKIDNDTGFIFLMDENHTVDAPIALNAGSKQNITITSTDYTQDGQPQTDSEGQILQKSLIRSGGGSMFTVSNNAKLKFTDIKLDGGGQGDPLIDVTGGTVGVGSRTEITGCTGGDGSAVKVTGDNSGLELNGGMITGNTTNGNGVVYYDGAAGSFKVQGDTTIFGNTNSNNEDNEPTAPNVYLTTGRYVTVVGALNTVDGDNNKIGVTTRSVPSPSPGGVSTREDQEIVVAKPGGNYIASGASFADNFIDDTDGTKADKKCYITQGTNDGLLHNADSAVLKRDGSTLTVYFQDYDTSADVTGAPTTGFDPQYLAEGEEITAVTPPVITNYTFMEVQVAPADTVADDRLIKGTDGKVSGKMPNKDVDIIFLYQKNQGVFRFVANGAAPAPEDIAGAMGDSVNNRTMPEVRRLAYRFTGWSTNEHDDRKNPQKVEMLPEKYPEGETIYYAMLTPDENNTFAVNVLHSNKAGTVPFLTEDSDSTGKWVEAEFTKTPLTIPGYSLSASDSSTSPSSYIFMGDTPKTLGDFTLNPAKFTMPAQPMTVNFIYIPDTSVKKKLTVEHYLRINGETRSTPMKTDEYDLAAEAPISVSPIAGRGYEFKGVSYTDAQGREQAGAKLTAVTANLTAETVSGVPAWSTGLALAPESGELPDGTFTGVFDDDGAFTGTMPNQPVTIKYYYESTGDGYPYEICYLDREANYEDISSAGLGASASPIKSNMMADIEVTASPIAAPYGYTLITTGADAPKRSPATVQNEAGATVPVGSFDSAYKFTGTMPKQKLTVTYTYERDDSYWKNLTYKNGGHGTISNNGASSMLTESGSDYQAKVLAKIDDNTGWEQSYTWADIVNKKLVPVAAANANYMFEGWVVDTDGDGIDRDATTGKVISPDVLLPATIDENTPEDQSGYRFTAATTLIASFVKDPAKWRTVYFVPGENSEGESGNHKTSALIPIDRFWEATRNGVDDNGKRPVENGNNADLPDTLAWYRPVPNHINGAWYRQGADTPMQDVSPLENGAVYEFRYEPDPAVFGTDVAAPAAMAGIGADGKGRITVPGTTTGYRYILADQDGKIVSVLQGNVSGRVYFEGLYPETRYTVYEALATVQAQVGSPISSVTGTMSDPTEAPVPVVETNYQILYDDENEGKTVLKISPADKASDYAVLNEDGSLAAGWKTPTGSSPAAVSFPNLKYNENYVVVARPNGATDTAESRFADGTPITTDPGGELEIPKYTVEAVDGQVISVAGNPVGADSYNEAESGDKVVLRADAQNAAGYAFKYWKVLVGTVPGLSDTTTAREVSFTMPETNVVIAACYEDAPDTLTITHEVRGGNRHEMALDPDAVETLKGDAPNGLKAGVDESLLTANGANVTYKVVYKKTTVKATESNAIKTGGGPDGAYSDHEDAYRCAWGLDVSVERYVNGRRVAPAATPSDADLDTIVQLDREDVDMKDYCLYEIDEDGNVLAVDLTGDPEESGGLFRFTAHAGSRYVLAYARAYWLTFYDNTALEKFKHPFKVYRGESPSDRAYSGDDAYGKITPQPDFVNPADGVAYTFVSWSYSEDTDDPFADVRPILRKTNVYAFYENNGGEVLDARKEFEDEIKKALDKAADYFLKAAEAEEMKEFIREAQDVFNTNGATIEELIEALEVLKEKSKPFDRILETRYAHYNEMKGGNSGSGWGGGSSGGSGGSGGSSGGSGGASGGGQGPVDRPAAYVIDESRSYEVGTNGQWMPLDEAAGQWAFILNGGTRLTSIWAKLDYANGDVNKNGWYHFNSSGLMDKGWVKDEQQNWYYCNTEKDGWLGKMRTGWYDDAIDKCRYYLDPETGRMVTGWRKIDGKWYYFTTSNAGATYLFDSTTGEWAYVPGKEAPVGAMLTNTTTPDGYKVGPDGAWIE